MLDGLTLPVAFHEQRMGITVWPCCSRSRRAGPSGMVKDVSRPKLVPPALFLVRQKGCLLRVSGRLLELVAKSGRQPNRLRAISSVLPVGRKTTLWEWARASLVDAPLPFYSRVAGSFDRWYLRSAELRSVRAVFLPLISGRRMLSIRSPGSGVFGSWPSFQLNDTTVRDGLHFVPATGCSLHKQKLILRCPPVGFEEALLWPGPGFIATT